VQVRPIQREPEHGDPGSIVLQVCHCKGSKNRRELVTRAG
jgi:hypothetical protein